MKRLLTIFICLIMMCSTVACDKVNTPSESENNSLSTTENQVLSECKAAYLDFLKDKKESYRLFSLVYIDNDDIPELYLSGVSEAEFNNAVNTIFDFSRAISLYENAVSYRAIVGQLGGDNSVG